MIRSLWRVKKIEWQVLPTRGTAGRVIVIWKDEKLRCKEVLIGEDTISCLFKNCQREGEWVFTRVYCKGVNSEMEIVRKD